MLYHKARLNTICQTKQIHKREVCCKALTSAFHQTWGCEVNLLFEKLFSKLKQQSKHSGLHKVHLPKDR